MTTYNDEDRVDHDDDHDDHERRKYQYDHGYRGYCHQYELSSGFRRLGSKRVDMFAALCQPLEERHVRGGWRQQLEQGAPDRTRAAPLLALGHLLDWGDGVSSARQVVKHMSHAVLDGEVTHPMVHRLARAAMGQPSASGAAQKLLGLMGECGFLDIITEVPGSLATHMVLPSHLLLCLQARFPDKFLMCLGVDEHRLETFWAGLRKQRAFAAHVAAHTVLQGMGPDEWKRMVPITLHEDAGPFIKRKSVNVVSFSGLFAAGGEKISQFVIASYIKEGATSEVALAELWEPILRDFEKLLTHGVSQWRFLLLFAKGDLEVRSTSWGLVFVQRRR